MKKKEEEEGRRRKIEITGQNIMPALFHRVAI